MEGRGGRGRRAARSRGRVGCRGGISFIVSVFRWKGWVKGKGMGWAGGRGKGRCGKARRGKEGGGEGVRWKLSSASSSSVGTRDLNVECT